MVLLIFSCLVSCNSKYEDFKNLALNRKAYHSTAVDYFHTGHLATDGIQETYWQSDKSESQSLIVDLGGQSELSQIKINWGKLYATQFRVSVSNELKKPRTWKEIYFTDAGEGEIDEISIPSTHAQFIKLECFKSSDSNGYQVLELGVIGTGGYKHPNSPPNQLNEDAIFKLTNGWKLIKAPFISSTASKISSVGFQDSKWLPALVPGTVLSSYIDYGAIPDPNYGDQQFQISDSFSRTDYWYRNEIEIPPSFYGDQIWLNFDGINYVAIVYVNGDSLGTIRGTFAQQKFDISRYVSAGEKAAIGVLVSPPPYPTDVMTKTPDSTTFNLEYGLNSPTWIPAGAWDWIVTIRDRNTGIWNDVYITQSNGVSIENPWVITDLKLPDTTSAELEIQSELANHTGELIEGTLRYTIHPGNVTLDQNVVLEAYQSKVISIDQDSHTALKFSNPKLWWPNGYGEQNLYTLKAEFIMGEKTTDTKSIQFGIREFSYEPRPEATILLVNGHRVMARGGNWGISESMIRFKEDDFKNAIKMHKELNFTMIRNWSGSVSDRNFYEYCDKYGILIWDEFWYSGGPTPSDTELFMNNAITKIKNRRHHASLAVWAGANETELPEPLYEQIPSAIEELDGTRLYVHQSAEGLVRGGGPWVTQDPKFWFGENARGFMTEVGMTTVPPIESMREMMPEKSLWPINEMWALHDFIYRSYPHSNVYAEQIDKRFGKAKDLKDFTRKAQLLNMQDYKAIYEGFMAKLFEDASAVMVWMSHPAWPSLVWQIYDYYWEPTGAYWGAKKASEPIHILWNPINEEVIAVNHTNRTLDQVEAIATLYNLDGTMQSSQSQLITVAPASKQSSFEVRYPETLSSTHFIKLTLRKDDQLLSENFYWRGTEYLNYQALEKMENVSISSNATLRKEENAQYIDVTLSNNSTPIALAIRLKLVQKESGKRVLPAYYEDNYFSLLPGEKRTLSIEFDTKYLDGDNPQLLIEGWNIEDQEIQLVP